MKLIKVFDDDDLNPRSGWAYLEKGRLILKDDFMGFPAGSRLIVGSDHAVKMRDTSQLNELLKAEQKQAENLKGSFRMELHFNKNLDGSVEVETWKDSQGLDYTTLGQLTFDKDQGAWVYWPEDLSGDGVTYSSSLEETESTLKDEYAEFEAEKN